MPTPVAHAETSLDAAPVRGRLRRDRLAWAGCGVSLAAVAGSAPLVVRNGAAAERLIGEHILDVAVAAVSFAILGALVVTRQPANPVGWICCAIGLSQGPALVAHEYAVYGLETAPGAVPGGALASWIAVWWWAPGFVLAGTFLPLVFPTGALPSPRWRPVGWGAALSVLVLVVPAAVAGWPVRGDRLLADDIPASSALSRFAVATLDAGYVFMFATTVVCVASLLVRFRRSRGIERLQLQWVAYAAVVVVVLELASEAVSAGGTVLGLAAVPLVPAGIGVAMLRHRLYDIRLVVNRSTVYASLTACVIGAYVALVTVLSEVVRAGRAASLLATGVIAVAFQPLHVRLQRGVDRLLYGERHDPYAALSKVGQDLEAAEGHDDVLQELASSVAQTLRLPYVAIERLGPTGDGAVAAFGERRGEPLRLPLTYRGEPIGTLVVGARAGSAGFTTDEQRLLRDLSRQIGVTTYAVELATQLRDARDELATAREEERRRLRRDLHDGLGPSLTGIAMGIDAARHLWTRDPAAASALHGELVAQITTAVGDVRRLIDDLRPPALDQLGLVTAIRVRARELTRSSPLDVTVSTRGTQGPLPPAVETAAYRIAVEAVTNVIKHADARRCTVTITFGDDLQLTVTDDGDGPAPTDARGVGLNAMRERAAELGGTCTVGRAPSRGTRVHAVLPVASSPSGTRVR